MSYSLIVSCIFTSCYLVLIFASCIFSESVAFYRKRGPTPPYDCLVVTGTRTALGMINFAVAGAKV